VGNGAGLGGPAGIGLALGYEDLNDHNDLRLDALLAVAIGKEDPTGQDRLLARDSRVRPWPARARSIAWGSHAPRCRRQGPRTKKIVADPAGMDRPLVECFLEGHAQRPDEIWLDLDATDHLIRGQQEGRFFQGY
jgi:hypothetical protein